MNEDMPWVNLTQEEVEELCNKKHELTEYGKQRLKELMNKDLTFKTNGKETFSIPSQTLQNLTLGTKTPETKLEIKMTENYPDAMFEEAERREKLNAGFKQDADGNWYCPELKELTRNERIELAEKEVAYIVMGGQDGREYANSIAFILEVLDSLRDKESVFEDSADGVA
jgi:vancomycin resistance protein YoaR